MPRTNCKLEVSPDPLSVIFPRYYDISPHLESIEWWSGKERELDGIQAGGMQTVLDNDQRRFELGYLGDVTALTASGNEIDDALRSVGTQGDNFPYVDWEFWGDFEIEGAAGTAPGWVAMNGAVEAFAASRQLTYDAALGHRAARFEVAEDDKFGVTTGERCEVRRGTPNGGFLTGTPEGLTGFYEGSMEFEGPWTHTTAWEIWHQQHSFDSRFGQAMLRCQMNGDQTRFNFSMDSGEFPTLGDANAGTNAPTNLDIPMHAFEDDVTFHWRYWIKWSSDTDGWVVFEMRRDDETQWTRWVEEYDIATLATVAGDPLVSTVADKLGFYRHDVSGADAGVTNVVRHWGYRVGHWWHDPPADLPSGPDRTVGLFPAVTNLIENSDAITGGTPPTGSQSAGGGTTTITQETDPARCPFGSTSFKVVTNGAASGQGVFHRKRDGTRIPVTAGEYYMADCWFIGDGGEQVRIGIEWVNAAAAVISTTFAPARHLRPDARHYWLLAQAPVGAVTARIRTGLSGTDAATFWVGGVGFSQARFLPPHIRSDVAGGTARAAARVQAPASFLDETQFWFAARFRTAFASANPNDHYIGDWQDDATHRVSLYWDGSSSVFKLDRGNGAPISVSAGSIGFSIGDYITVIGIGSSTQLAISVTGKETLATVAASTQIPTLAAANFDLGSNAGAEQLTGYFLWAATGTGVLDQAGVDILHGFENTPPTMHDLTDYGVTMAWDGRLSTATGGSLIDMNRRFRVTLDDGETESAEGTYYLVQPNLNFRGKSKSSLVQFNCMDGVGLLGQQNLPRMDPPDATTFEEVVTFFNPSYYHRFGEQGGTKSVSHTRRKRKRRKGESKRHYRHHGFRHWTTRETRPESEGTSGPAGTYKNTPTLGRPGAILGDDDTCVFFNEASAERMEINGLDSADLSGISALTVGIFYKATTVPQTGTLVSGPWRNDASNPIFQLGFGSDTVFFSWIDNNTGLDTLLAALVLEADIWYFIAGVIDGTAAALYVGERGGTLDLVDSNTYGLAQVLEQPTAAGANIQVGYSTDFIDGITGDYDEMPIIEAALTQAELQGILTAASRGYPVQTAGERIAALSDNPLWETTRIQTAGYDVQPVFQYGQAPQEEIDAAAEAEMPDSLYFFDGDAQPVYLAVGYKATAPYDTVAVTLSNEAGEGVRYDDRAIDWDPEIYNIVPGSKDGGREQLATDQDSIDERGEHTFGGATGLLNNDDADVLTIVEAIRDRYGGAPVVRPKSVTLHGVDDDSRAEIMTREIGDLVRFIHHGDVGDPIDVNCRILGWRKRYEKGQLTATWFLSRAE